MTDKSKNKQAEDNTNLEVTNVDNVIADDQPDLVIQKKPIFNIGDVVKHRLYPFRGVIVDVDPEFSNTEEWYKSIPAEIRPSKDQPYYHLMAENTETYYSAYVSQQNLVLDGDNGPVDHPDLDQIFIGLKKGKYFLKSIVKN